MIIRRWRMKDERRSRFISNSPSSVDSRFSSVWRVSASLDTSVHLPCFAWYTVEVITSLDIGILIYVTIDRPPPSTIPSQLAPFTVLPARISHTELPSGSSPKVGAQTISSLRMCIYTRYISILKINRAETTLPLSPPLEARRIHGINCICRLPPLFRTIVKDQEGVGRAFESLFSTRFRNFLLRGSIRSDNLSRNLDASRLCLLQL